MMMKRTRARLSTARPNKQPSLPRANASDPLGYRTKNINVQAVYEKNMTMAQEALAIGDRILAEGFYQRADHFLRIMNESKQTLPTISPSKKTSPSPDDPIDDNDFESSMLEELEMAQFGGNLKMSPDQGAMVTA